MMTTTDTTRFACTCGRCPESRLARGLRCFNDRALKASGHDRAGTFPTYAAAVAAYPGRRIALVSGGTGTGSPRCFGPAEVK